MRAARIACSAIVAILALVLLLAAIATFGALAIGDTGDMAVSGVIELGLVYAALAAGAAAGSWNIWPRRATRGA